MCCGRFGDLTRLSLFRHPRSPIHLNESLLSAFVTGKQNGLMLKRGRQSTKQLKSSAICMRATRLRFGARMSFALAVPCHHRRIRGNNYCRTNIQEWLTNKKEDSGGSMELAQCSWS